MSGVMTLRNEWEPRVLSIVRIVAGLLYLQHGLNKMLNFPPTPTHVPYAENMFSLVPGVAGLIEVFGSLLLIFGLFTRPVAFIISGEMAIAYFYAHQPRNFFPLLNAGEPAILYCFIFLYLFVAGGGCWSLDRLMSRGGRS
jgi:putative oxidoreductase